MRYRLFFISSFVLYTGAAHAADDVFRIMLEEPGRAKFMVEWAISEAGQWRPTASTRSRS